MVQIDGTNTEPANRGVSEPRQPMTAELDGPAPKSSDANRGQQTRSAMFRSLPPPVMIPGENIQDFQALLDEVSEEVQPQTFFDSVMVADICHAIWDEQRYRRQQAALPGSTRLKALACLLVSSGFDQNAISIACDYFCRDDEEERTKAKTLVRGLGITEDAIAAQASLENMPALMALERLVMNRQSRRDIQVSEYRRLKRKADKSTLRRSGTDATAVVTH